MFGFRKNDMFPAYLRKGMTCLYFDFVLALSACLCLFTLQMTTVDGFIFVGTDWLNENDTFVRFKIRGHKLFLHNSYRQSLIRGYWNSWIGPSTKTTKIGTPWKLSHPQCYICIDVFVCAMNMIERNNLKKLQKKVTGLYCELYLWFSEIKRLYTLQTK